MSNSSTKAKKIEDYIALAKEHGIFWLGQSLPLNTKQKTTWQCQNGHVFQRSYSLQDSSQKRTGFVCPDCGIESRVDGTRLTSEDYVNACKGRGFKWVGDTPPRRNHDNTLWECLTCGNIWESTIKNVTKSVIGCPKCHRMQQGDNQRKTAKDYHEVALSKNMLWMGTKVPKTTIHNTLWACHNGHQYESQYATIQKSVGCKYCNNYAAKTEDDYHEAANRFGFKWIGETLPSNTSEKTLWECSNGHITEKEYHSLVNGRGCPECKNRVNGILISSQQEWLCDLVEGEMNVQIEGYYADVLTVIDDKQIVIEYDGWYWHKDRQGEDEQRNQAWLNVGCKVLRVKSSHALPDKEEVLDAIIHLLETDDMYYEIVLEDWGD